MVLHALFGNEQDSCCNHQAAANNVEDGGADAAGAGQGSAAFVLDGNNFSSPASVKSSSLALAILYLTV